MTAPASSPDLVIRGCDVLVVPAEGPCSVDRDRDIVIGGGAILDVVPGGSAAVADGVELLDGRGLLATPGLINAHTHSPMVLFRGAAEDVSVESWFNERIWPMESNLADDDVHVGALAACAEMIRAGVTAFADHYFQSEQIAAAVESSGIRANLGPTYFSSDGPGALEAMAGFAQDWNGAASGRITVALGPHAPYTVDDADLEAIARHAVQLGLRVHLHAAENMAQTESSLARLGVTPIQVLESTGILDAGVLIAHGCGITPDDIELLGQRADRVAVASCPKVYLKHALHPMTPIRALQDAGIAVAVGTDGAAGHNTLDVWEAMRLVALTQKYETRDAEFMTVSDALRLAMRGGAAAIGQPEALGALEPGRRADVVLVDLSGVHCRPLHDPRAALVYSTRASDVRSVVVDGRVLLRDGQLLTIDEQPLLRELDARMSRLVDRSSGRAVQFYAP